MSLDEARAELIRSRAFIRGAETQLTKALAALDAAMEQPAPEPEPEPQPEPEPEPTEPVEPPPAPSDGRAFILGPQVPLGQSPWPWFDEMAVTQGPRFAAAFPDPVLNADGTAATGSDPVWMGNYYDLVLCLYALHERSGDPAHLAEARRIADLYYDFHAYSVGKYGTTSPRHQCFGGQILRAMDGRADQWAFITEQARKSYRTWLGLRLDYPGLYIGIRESAFTLMHLCWLAVAHPDEAVRAEMRANADAAVHQYFLRLEAQGYTGPDGGTAQGGFWWTDSLVRDGQSLFAQPFMVGLLLEAFIYYHQLTQDTEVAALIPRTVEWLHGYYRVDEPVVTDHAPTKPEVEGVSWRNHPYLIFPDGTWSSATSLPGGWDTNTIREARQANSDLCAAYGYAYRLTGDVRFREWGDEVFAATFGKGEGPLADPFYNLADYNAKSYGQAYRSAGRYLYWRQ